MRRLLKEVAVLVLLLGLAGCAGTDFVRPSTDELKVGQATYSQVVARMGKPWREGTAMKNDKMVKSATYAYASVGGQPLRPGVTPARAMSFYFYDDTLVGHEFVSSWAEDHSDFDEGRVKDIVKGKTTRAELVQLLGKPAGTYVYPMIKDETGEAAVYLYSETTGSAFNLKFSRKALVVSFDRAGLASDVDFSSSGSSPAPSAR